MHRIKDWFREELNASDGHFGLLLVQVLVITGAFVLHGVVQRCAGRSSWLVFVLGGVIGAFAGWLLIDRVLR